MIARLSAWWTMTQWYVVLVGIIAALAWLNVHQWKASIRQKDRAEISALNDAIAKVNGLAERKVEDDAKTQKRLADIADQSEEALRRYSRAASQKPLPPECAPGPERVDAINAGLGPQK